MNLLDQLEEEVDLGRCQFRLLVDIGVDQEVPRFQDPETGEDLDLGRDQNQGVDEVTNAKILGLDLDRDRELVNAKLLGLGLGLGRDRGEQEGAVVDFFIK